mmetsp:Transcript_31427/g.84043  ORF Transcript_31427/g.84043 Transcript_31427/m.84043 type:complete len:350 (-) Transcript_31427:71-1120(-)
MLPADQRFEQVAECVHEERVDQQRIHALGHAVEVGLLDGGALVHRLLDQDRKHVETNEEQHEGRQHRPHGLPQSLQLDQQLRDGPQQPAHPQHPRQPHESRYSQKRRVAKNASPRGARSKDLHDQRHNPGLDHHGGHQYRVEEEPTVPEAVALELEGNEPHGPFEAEVDTEEVLGNLELHGRLAQHLVVVVHVVRLPHGVGNNNRQSGPLEDAVLRQGGSAASPPWPGRRPVEHRDVVLRLRQALLEVVLYQELLLGGGAAPVGFVQPPFLDGLARDLVHDPGQSAHRLEHHHGARLRRGRVGGRYLWRHLGLLLVQAVQALGPRPRRGRGVHGQALGVGQRDLVVHGR